ncbi:HAMP domain-containing histidine kinase [Arsenicitalea aurantiaca]|uniref:histidine kinase n=2 Tax=Arsenicitalea aurantiaca TaxID=1783274 RepID=A0A433X8Q1_9HYPH|nr:HAMP domain-containing histidine kinase [Arsenicitalea aurantiaca]
MMVDEQSAERANPGWRALRLDTLVRLRWLAVTGQTAAVMFVEYGLGYPTPLLACMALIGVSALFNLLLMVRFGAGHRPSPVFIALTLAWDCCQLGALLALTGGLQNPFSLLLLAPVSVSSTTLPRRATFAISALVIAIASLISLVHLPLPWDPQSRIVFNRIYVIGIWVSIVCGVVFIAAYTTRVAHEARQLAQGLAATELALSRHERLNALDGLAAAAAHELGTPLSTIALAAKEMKADIPPGPLAEDVDLIISQAARCRAILQKLRNLDGNAAAPDPFAVMALGEVVAEVAKPHEGAGRTIRIVRTGEEGAPEPEVARNVGLLYGLGNLIENAVQFARSEVRIDLSWDEATVGVTITDDGPGFSIDLLARLGEPYLTTRPRTGPNADPTRPGGLGLGVFISKTLLERTGARIAFGNETDAGHARVRIVWARERIAARGTGEPAPPGRV